jgi:hypothetical protein
MAQLRFPRIKGIDQLADETALVDEDGTMRVREALNVDIDVDGNVSRRAGASLDLAGSGYHSLYYSNRGWLMVCSKNQLGVYDSNIQSFTALAQMDTSQRVSYAELNGNLYASNPSFNCMFMPNSTDAKSIGVPLPTVEPEFAMQSDGGLEPGSYGITYTVIDPDGEESGTGPVQQIELPDGGGIVGTMFTVMSGYKYRVYLTAANGETLREAVEFDADTTSITILSAAQGRECRTHGYEPAPYGHIIRAHGSRLLIATTDYVYFTEAFRPHLIAPTGYIKTNGFVSMVEPVDGGVFVADKSGVTFYKGDDPVQWRAGDASPDKPIFGTSTVLSGEHFRGELRNFESIAVWLTQYGYQLGLPNGEVVRLNADQIRTPAYSQGCTAAIVRDGRKQLVTPVNSNVLANASVALDSTIA